jgi:hypothetical protein
MQELVSGSSLVHNGDNHPIHHYLPPKVVLSVIEASLENFLASYLNEVEAIIQKNMQILVKDKLPMVDSFSPEIKNLSFNIEIIGRSFKIVPHNFFTYLVSEGIVVPYSTVENARRYRTSDGEYIYNPLSKEGVFIPESIGHDSWPNQSYSDILS